MSLVTKLSDAAYCGYVIGKAVERRRHWMDRARDIKSRGDSQIYLRSITDAVQHAREQSRAIVEQLRMLRREAQS